MTYSPTEAARKGAQLLDQRYPGWEQRVNPATLNIEDGRCCVLGQIGSYHILAEELFGDGDTGYDAEYDHGFFTSWPLSQRDALNACWREEIASRHLRTRSGAGAGGSTEPGSVSGGAMLPLAPDTHTARSGAA